jgi:hypothetical protein
MCYVLFAVAASVRLFPYHYGLRKVRTAAGVFISRLWLIHTYHSVSIPFLFRAHAVTLPCRAAKGSDCVFPI